MNQVVFIHGLGGKPPEEPYLQEWIQSLTRDNPNLKLMPGVTNYSMIYWADLRGQIAPQKEYGTKQIVNGLATPQRRALETKSDKGININWYHRLFDWIIDRIFYRLDILMPHLLDWLVDDIYNYFYHKSNREAIGHRFDKIMLAAYARIEPGDKLILISHSMGTIIAMDRLQTWSHKIDLHVTMGSPLGMEWIQSKLGRPKYPWYVQRWLNVFDDEDPVSIVDQHLRDDFPNADSPISDIQVPTNHNQKGEVDHHHWNGYLGSKALRMAIDDTIT
jgi:hypothetical protein